MRAVEVGDDDLHDGQALNSDTGAAAAAGAAEDIEVDMVLGPGDLPRWCGGPGLSYPQ